jgi:hypothetical protein
LTLKKAKSLFADAVRVVIELGAFGGWRAAKRRGRRRVCARWRVKVGVEVYWVAAAAAACMQSASAA